MMLNDTSQMLADQLDRLLAARVTPQLIAKSEAGQGNDGLDAAIEELGLSLALVPEEAGGAGLCWRDIGASLQTLGYHAAPSDLGEQIVANHLMSILGQPVEGVPPSIALDPVSGAGDTVSGRLLVPWGLAGAPLLAEAENRLCLIDTGGADSTSLRTVGRIPSLAVTLTDAPVIASAPLPAVGPIGLIAAVRSAQIAGALSRILELSIEYGNTREQFGRPIGKFQAVQHLIARLAGEAGCAKAAAELGLSALDSGVGWEGVAVAKIRASRAVSPGADSAHEVHGAIGVTEEYMLHYFTRRLWQWREEAGDEDDWAEKLGRAAIKRGGSALWPGILSLTGQ